MHGKHIVSTQSSIMSHTPQPLVPIVIHPGSWIQPLGDSEGSKTFFCLDSVEFGNRVSSMVSQIRNQAGASVPIVVVGSAADEHQQMHDEANRVAQAGAIYFERPSGPVSIDELAGTIGNELARILDAPETFCQQAKDSDTGAALERRNGDEHRFYVEAPFHLTDASLKTLLDRFEMSDTDPRKDD